MPEPLVPSTGWNVLHLFLKAESGLDREAFSTAVKAAEEAELQVITVSMLGHKADACVIGIGADMWQMRKLQTRLQAAGTEVVDSYVSLTEVSEYAGEMTDGMKRGRLYPKFDRLEKRAFCFYPMTKRRGEQNNWYDLPFDKRKELMFEHGMSGRRFSGRVVQMVTGSTGTDDYEWGVSLFAEHPDDLKACVYELRYDEASRLYGEFGRFYTGIVATVDEVLDHLVP